MAGDERDAPPSPLDDFPSDRFYHGVIHKIFRGKQWGLLRAGSGREIPFEFAYVTLLGGYRRCDELREGMHVGYDVGWTSRGLRVTVIRPNQPIQANP